MAIPFECANPSVSAARQILIAALEANSDLRQLGGGDEQYQEFAEFVGPRIGGILGFAIHKAFWQLFLEGVVAPGYNSSNEKFPFFHVTDYGKKVLSGDAAPVHDPDRYLARVEARVSTFDPTVRSYLSESLATFARGNLVSSAVMLGIASERVFVLLCEAIETAISDSTEATRFKDICSRFPMKPKLDFVVAKFQEKSVRKLPDFPDNAHIAVLAVYDFLRVQRNDFGHPKPAPPAPEREDMFANLQVFARYYETVDRIGSILSANSI